MNWSTPPDWDAAYSNRAAVPDAGAFAPRWSEQAAAFRAGMAQEGRARLDLSYGEGARDVFDLFSPTGAARGLFVFVHGGYWLTYDKSFWSHLAQGPLSRGWAVAFPSYPLAPQARIEAISVCVARAIEAAAREVDGPLRLSGHSAGGHLVTRAICAGSALGEATLARVEAVISISGVHDLRPLMKTAMNAQLGLDMREASSESPALLVPRRAIATTCWVGAIELAEFRRQNALLANAWTGLGVSTQCVEAAGRHHFDVVDDLRDPSSRLCEICAP